MADTPDDSNEQQKDGPTLADGVRLIVLGWSATLLTISYLGIFPGMKMDSTFVASLLTGAMAGFGIERKSGNATKKDAPKIPTNGK
tara:strand:+ start:94 stop:351 length:258 start_codon:yes stop_codon:yes gene_type:complete